MKSGHRTDFPVIHTTSKNCKSAELIAKLRQFIAVICLGPISFGASLNWTSPTLPQLQNPNSTLPFSVTVAEGSWMASMLAFGVLTAAIPSGYLADRLGPKLCVLALVFPHLLFTIIVALAEDVYLLCLARFISGISSGGVSVISPIYIADIADDSLRGTLGTFFELLTFVGVIFVSTIGAYVRYVALTFVMGGVALMCGIVFLFFPESPTYLLKINKTEKAIAALRFYRSDNCDVAKNLEEMTTGLKLLQQRTPKVNLKKALLSKPVIRGLIACSGITIFQQLSAVDAIIFYTVSIFETADTKLDSYNSAIAITVSQLFGAILILFLIEKAGRRFFLFVSVGICGISLLVLATFFHLKHLEIDIIGMNYIPLLTLIAFSIGFTLGLGPIPWMVNGELFLHEIKGIANGITITLNWVFLFMVTKTLPTAMEEFGHHIPFYFFSVCMAVCIVFIYFCIPETRGKTLEQIQIELNA
ncbi:hypothetical protein FQA39_LY02968 [Lamprigera yunnana]|nr:hypothetical protein FQA39_LY02968 [Lamprigera yunnana]